MLHRAALAALPLALAVATASAAPVTLPTGWRLSPPPGRAAATGTMPQGLALSPGERRIAVVDAGFNPPALRILDSASLKTLARIPLAGAFGAPVWRDPNHVLVAGANADAVLDVDLRTKRVKALPEGKGSWPAAVALAKDGSIAAVDDGTGSVTLGGTAIAVGAHPSAAVFSPGGRTLYVAVRQPSEIAAIDVRRKRIAARIPVGSDPAALAIAGNTLYAADSNGDAITQIDTRTNRAVHTISVELAQGRTRGYGASPNGLFAHGGDLFVSLGAEDAVALIRGGKLVERIPAGWYPTGVALSSRTGTLYVVNGRGERAPANPQFDPLVRNSGGYVGAIDAGSIRAIPRSAYSRARAETAAVTADAAPLWTPAPLAQTVVRPNGPIRHVIYVIKENRSYDQVLGDLRGGNGDASLAMFGARVTPNQHALERRFGIFDNAYVDAQVSATGHNWTDAAFADDYVERFWPANYAGRRDLYDFQSGTAPDVPHGGYLWDDAERAHVTFRDYGEDIDFPHGDAEAGIDTFPGLAGRFDPHYVGWDLNYSDLSRYAEWKREFDGYVRGGNLPHFEIVYLPNDHTYGTAPGKPTPQAYIATNDWAVGKLVDRVSHSRYWASTAIFILEDDAQNGPDHVSDQRSTFYIASPYARGGLQHAHYSTAGFIHTMELILGLPPLSIYDATARPLYAAFAVKPVNARPFDAVEPAVDMHAVNAKTAYGAALSAKLNFSKPDAIDPRVLNAILAHSGSR